MPDSQPPSDLTVGEIYRSTRRMEDMLHSIDRQLDDMVSKKDYNRDLGKFDGRVQTLEAHMSQTQTHENRITKFETGFAWVVGIVGSIIIAALLSLVIIQPI